MFGEEGLLIHNRLTQEQLQSLQENGKSLYLNEMTQFQEQNQALQQNTRVVFGSQKADSAEMARVKQSVNDLNLFFGTYMNTADKAAFDEQRRAGAARYDQVIDAGRAYVKAKGHPFTSAGKARLKMVQRVLAQAERERALFDDCAQELYLKAGGQSIYWGNVLGEIRAAHLNADRLPTEEVGNGTSEVLKIQYGEGYVYFKAEEKLPPEKIDELITEYNEQRGKEADWAKVRAELNEMDLDTLGDAIFQLSDLVRRFRLRLDRDDVPRETIDGILDDSTLQELMGVVPQDSAFRTPQGFLEFCRMAVTISKQATLANICSQGKIPKNTLVSPRNVATSRVAKMLGVNDLFAESRTVVLKKDGKEIRGNLMREAKGTPGCDLYVRYDEELRRQGQKPTLEYSPEALRQLTLLQLMDSLCAQVDRNASNYLMQWHEENGRVVVTGAMGIDNDVAFGAMSYESLKAGRNSLRGIELDNDPGMCSIPVIDKEFYERLMALTPEVLEYSLCDLLSQEELNALKDRLKGLQDLLTHTAENREGFLVNNAAGWTNAVDRFRTPPAGGGTWKTYVGNDYLPRAVKEQA